MDENLFTNIHYSGKYSYSDVFNVDALSESRSDIDTNSLQSNDRKSNIKSDSYSVAWKSNRMTCNAFNVVHGGSIACICEEVAYQHLAKLGYQKIDQKMHFTSISLNYLSASSGDLVVNSLYDKSLSLSLQENAPFYHTVLVKKAKKDSIGVQCQLRAEPMDL